MKKFFGIILLSSLFLSISGIVFAFEAPRIPEQGGLDANVIIKAFDSVLKWMWQIFFGFAVIMFLVAGFTFLTGRGNPEKVKASMQAVIWGVVGFIVGIVAFSIPTIVQCTIEGCGGF